MRGLTFNEDTYDDMYVNKHALVPVPQFADCPEVSDVSQSTAARATERKISDDIMIWCTKHYTTIFYMFLI